MHAVQARRRQRLRAVCRRQRQLRRRRRVFDFGDLQGPAVAALGEQAAAAARHDRLEHAQLGQQGLRVQAGFAHVAGLPHLGQAATEEGGEEAQGHRQQHEGQHHLQQGEAALPPHGQPAHDPPSPRRRLTSPVSHATSTRQRACWYASTKRPPLAEPSGKKRTAAWPWAGCSSRATVATMRSDAGQSPSRPSAPCQRRRSRSITNTCSRPLAMARARVKRRSAARSRALPRSSRPGRAWPTTMARSEEHTSELQSRENLVCRLLPEKTKRAVQQMVSYMSLPSVLTITSSSQPCIASVSPPLRPTCAFFCVLCYSLRRAPCSALFPYTTLFRSSRPLAMARARVKRRSAARSRALPRSSRPGRAWPTTMA